MSDPFVAPSQENSFGGPRRRWQLKRIGPVSAGLFAGAAGAIMGLFAGIVLALFTGIGAAGVQGNPQGMNAVVGLGAFGIVVLPLFYGIMGFIGGVINAFVYNIVAGLTGGISLEFDQV